MASVRSFHRYRGESSFTMSQFIAILREQLPQVAPSQTKYRVTEIPSERTIRFYTANNLVDKPVAREGSHARYGYRHLLQVLSIKYLQSQYLPLVKIRSLVENVSNRDLEILIPEIPTVTAAHRGIAREDRRIVENSFIPQIFSFTPEKKFQETSGDTAASRCHSQRHLAARRDRAGDRTARARHGPLRGGHRTAERSAAAGNRRTSRLVRGGGKITPAEALAPGRGSGLCVTARRARTSAVRWKRGVCASCTSSRGQPSCGCLSIGSSCRPSSSSSSRS